MAVINKGLYPEMGVMNYGLQQISDSRQFKLASNLPDF